MGEGWETARRRGPGNDWVALRLAGAGVIRLAELDTTWSIGNAPDTARLTGLRAGGDPADGAAWVELMPRTRLLPDTRHRFVLEPGPEVTDVRLDVYPDGGMARLRLWGTFSPAGRSRLGRLWFDSLPDAQAAAVLTAAGLPPALARSRPTLDAGRADPALALMLDGP